MRWILRVAVVLAVLFCISFLHYTLPQRDIVRVVNTYTERQALSGWTTMFWGGAQSPPVNGVETRDVQFVQAVKPNGKVMVYRNEDTGWRWPPYFKFDTATLFTQAADAVSTKDAPTWVIVSHYGWRSELLSTFPNAVKIKPATGPDQQLWPIKNGVILLGILVVILLIRRLWIGFRKRTIDPLMTAAGERLEDAGDFTQERTRGLKSLFARKK